MTRSLSASGRPESSIASSPRSTNVSEFGAMGGAAIGIWVIHGCRSIISRWTVAHVRNRARQPSPVSTRSSAPWALAFHISWRSSSLLATCRYSDMVVNPSCSATRAMETASRPSASASRMAAATIASTDRPGFGPRWPRPRRPQSRSRPGGSGGEPGIALTRVASHPELPGTLSGHGSLRHPATLRAAAFRVADTRLTTTVYATYSSVYVIHS